MGPVYWMSTTFTRSLKVFNKIRTFFFQTPDGMNELHTWSSIKKFWFVLGYALRAVPHIVYCFQSFYQYQLKLTSANTEINKRKTQRKQYGVFQIIPRASCGGWHHWAKIIIERTSISFQEFNNHTDIFFVWRSNEQNARGRSHTWRIRRNRL